MRPSRSLTAAALLAFALAACEGKGEHNNPANEDEQKAGADSLSTGEAVQSTAPPVGTVNPGAPSGPGASPTTDSASHAAHADSGHTDTTSAGTQP